MSEGLSFPEELGRVWWGLGRVDVAPRVILLQVTDMREEKEKAVTLRADESIYLHDFT